MAEYLHVLGFLLYLNAKLIKPDYKHHFYDDVCTDIICMMMSIGRFLHMQCFILNH